MDKSKKSIAGKLDSLFPNCKEVTMLIVKEQEIKLSFVEKIKLYFHSYIVCKFCRAFRIQSGFLHKHIHQMAEGSLSPNTTYSLNDEKKSLMQKAINDSLSA